MIIDEKGLISAMKDAYKSSGYNVTVEEDAAGVPNVIIGTGWWTVVIAKESLPRKVLGLIAEHVGDIPDAGEAYRVMKGEPQTEIFGVAVQMLRSVHDGDKPLKLIKRTDLTLGGNRLWQRKDDLKMFEVYPNWEDILLTSKGTMRIVGDKALMLDDMESRGYVLVEPADQDRTERLAHLGKIAWVV